MGAIRKIQEPDCILRKGIVMPENDELFEEMAVSDKERAFAGHSCLCAVTPYADTEDSPEE